VGEPTILAAATTQACQQLARRHGQGESLGICPEASGSRKTRPLPADDGKKSPAVVISAQNALEQLLRSLGRHQRPGRVWACGAIPAHPATEQDRRQPNMVRLPSGAGQRAAGPPWNFAGQHPELSGDVIMAIAEACSPE